ncbi:unnamed protein product, partial [marine sediment metagenome]
RFECFFTGNTGKIDEDYWNSCGNGTIVIKFYANNSFGNIGYKEVVIYRDIYFPFLEVFSPTQNQVFGNAPPTFNFSISSIAIHSMWYSLNGLENIIIFDTFGFIEPTAWDVCGNGSVSIIFYVNNTYGQINSKEVIVEKNIRTPEIVILSPQNSTLFGIETINYEISVIDPDLETIWYTLNGVFAEIILQNQGHVDQILWDMCGNGTVIIGFFANNSLGNIGYTAVTVHRDIYYPFIEIVAPVPNQFCGTIAPSFNFTVSTLALDTLWYTVNESAHNIVIMSEGLLDQ